MAFNGKARRVVVTGMGAVTPLGLTVDEYWRNLLAGVSGVSPITYFDVSQYDTKFAAQLKNFDPLKYCTFQKHHCLLHHHKKFPGCILQYSSFFIPYNTVVLSTKEMVVENF